MPHHRTKAMFHATALVRDDEHAVERSAALIPLRGLEPSDSLTRPSADARASR
jgi:hypothetical protein